MDTPAEPEFDELVSLAAAICGSPISLITLLDERRQWFKAAKGLDMPETDRGVAFCAHTIQQDGVFIVENAEEDARFANNPLVTGAPNIRFYAGVPISSPDGQPLGSLCVIDRKPRHLTDAQLDALTVLGHQVNARLELRLRRLQLEATIADRDRTLVQLRSSEERFRAFMDSSPFMSFIKEMDGRLSYYNKRFAEHFGIDSDEWLGKTDFDLWPKDSASSARDRDVEVMRSGKLQMVTEQSSQADGTITYWRSYKFPCRNPDGMTVLGTISVDITEALAREQALHKTHVELRAANIQLSELATTDPLTGLFNRRVFDERLAAEMTAATRGVSLAVLLLDVDEFKRCNDIYGHPAGDAVLQTIARVIKREVRGTDIAVRLGGDEFAVLLPGATEAAAYALATRIAKRLENTEWPYEKISVSMGVAERAHGNASTAEFIAAADAALYAAKLAGKSLIRRASKMAH